MHTAIASAETSVSRSSRRMDIIGRLNRVANAANGADETCAQLLAQRMNIDFHRVALDLLAPPVDAFFELRARQDGAWALHQRFQQRELARGERDRPTFDG